MNSFFLLVESLLRLLCGCGLVTVGNRALKSEADSKIPNESCQDDVLCLFYMFSFTRYVLDD